MKFKKNDTVKVISGKDKGRKGKIDRLFPKTGKVLVPGINMYKRHMKKRDESNPGGIIDKSRAISVSKLALVCPKCSQKTRIGYVITGKEKTRICRKCEQTV